MPKQPNAVAGPSTNRGRPHKVIQKTKELVDKSDKGKAKESQVLGGLTRLIGETKTLPNALQVEKFAKIRALEIFAFQNAIKSAASVMRPDGFKGRLESFKPCLVTFDAALLPITLVASQSVSAPALPPKRAKLRARGNLRGQSRTDQLLLRQRDKSWLPTHLYHAKRFHMVNLWGYRLPLTPTLKSFRHAYRASKRKCMVFDTSYFGVIELEGDREGIMSVLGRMTGGPFAGPKYESGSRMAETMLYHVDSFPLGLIGPAEILWCSGGTKVWVRLHPSIWQEAFEAIKLAASRYSGGNIVLIRDLREDLGSFEFVGPLGGRLIRRVLRVCRKESQSKKQLFNVLGDPNILPRGLVTGIEVYDPRLHFPPPPLRREDAASTDDSAGKSTLAQGSTELATSDLWDDELRERSLRPTYKKSALDHRRHHLSLPGTKLRPLAQDDRIPMMLVAKGDSYTLLFPRGWSQAILHSIVYTGTFLGGLDERQAWHRESGVPAFPEHYGNVCQAGREWEDMAVAEDQRRWNRRPPGRRIDHPTWRPDWEKILGLTEEEVMNGQKPWALPAAFAPFAEKVEEAVNAFRKQRAMGPTAGLDKSGVVLVKLEVEGRGSPGRMAQIYQLAGEERSRWVETVERGVDRVSSDISPAQEVSRDLLVILVADAQIGEEEPDASRLVGYTTTGNFSLSRGCGFALGTITLQAWIAMSKLEKEQADGRGVLVKVRNNGGKICRLARLEMV